MEKEFEEWNKKVDNIPPIPETKTKDKDLEEWALRDTEVSKVYKQLIKSTHGSCPMLNNGSKVSVCIQDPKTNKGYIISLCCKKCHAGIQKSLNDGDDKYSIIQFKDIFVLAKEGVPKQVVPLCSPQNMKGVTSLIGSSSN